MYQATISSKENDTNEKIYVGIISFICKEIFKKLQFNLIIISKVMNKISISE